MIYAPGEWEGYGSQTFPLVYEALDKLTDVQDAIHSIANKITNVADFWNGKIKFNP